MAEIVIRRAATVGDYQACQTAQRLAWGITSDGYVVPVATMVGAQLHGGLVLGAFRPDGEAVGLSFAFLGRLESQLCLYSQLTGVIPDYQGQGIGQRLKQAQWDYAQQQGLALVAWAFDPLQSGNAHFNFAHLGVTSRHYVENMYGLRTDAVNAGAPTDRLIVEWPTTPRRPRGFAEEAMAIDRLPQVIEIGPTDQWRLAIDTWTAPHLLLEIPEQIGRLRQERTALALAWRQAVRSGFLAAFAAGYRATGFVREDTAAGRRCFYLLERETTA